MNFHHFLHKTNGFVKKMVKIQDFIHQKVQNVENIPNQSFSRSIFPSEIHFSHLEVDLRPQNRLFHEFLLKIFHIFHQKVDIFVKNEEFFFKQCYFSLKTSGNVTQTLCKVLRCRCAHLQVVLVDVFGYLAEIDLKCVLFETKLSKNRAKFSKIA